MPSAQARQRLQCGGQIDGLWIAAGTGEISEESCACADWHGVWHDGVAFPLTWREFEQRDGR